jgi:hypothetical protein
VPRATSAPRAWPGLRSFGFRSTPVPQADNSRDVLDSEEQVLFEQDMARVRAAMEPTWLESTPAREESPPLARGEGILAHALIPVDVAGSLWVKDVAWRPRAFR